MKWILCCFRQHAICIGNGASGSCQGLYLATLTQRLQVMGAGNFGSTIEVVAIGIISFSFLSSGALQNVTIAGRRCLLMATL
jgi:hypothetical protein